MKFSVACLVALAAPASAKQLVAQNVAKTDMTPMAMVVQLVTELEAKVQADGLEEQASYDKYSCWCESTLARKANDISDAKTTIQEATTTIEKLKGEIATHGAEIENLNKAIEANIASQREAEDARSRENEEYTGEKIESEQCIGALEAAITVLNGAGTGKKGFLEIKEAQLLSVVGGVGGLLRHSLVSRVVSPGDMKVLKSFVERPQDFAAGSHAMTALQIANNPFGDYAPQSTRVQGILKAMYDAFAADLEKSNAEESEEQKAFTELMNTKKAELKTLQATLQHHTVNKASKEKEEAQTQQLRDDNQEQQAADEKFFDETKAACQTKARQWSERSRLRTEEQQGMQKAIQILSSPAAQATFVNSTTTLLQVSSSDHVRVQSSLGSWRALQRLRTVARKFHSFRLAKVAASIQTAGHFDKVILAIDQMMGVLRKEEQDDVSHRDRCQVSSNSNKNDLEDQAHSIEMSDKALAKMDDERTSMETDVNSHEAAINGTKTDMAELLALRNKASADFTQALKDDMDAIVLLNQAIISLTKFYDTNKIPLALLSKQSPEYTIDKDKAPDTTWTDENYGGRSSESSGIIGILSLIKEDLENEIKTGRWPLRGGSQFREPYPSKDITKKASKHLNATLFFCFGFGSYLACTFLSTFSVVPAYLQAA